MSRRLSAADIFDTLEVDLWGNAYTLRQVTKSVSAKLAEAQKSVEALDDGDLDEQAKALIAMVDVLLEPEAAGKPAGGVLQGMWDKDELGLDWLGAFAQSLAEESTARRRPTSPRVNSA